jgi:CRISPR system Cascade subunit CasA
MKWGLHMSEFNLIDEPWIRVAKGTEICTVGLHELFKNAHEYDGLAGELPTQDFAVLRLLLAIMYGSLYKDIQNEEEAIYLWERLYKAGRFDMNMIGSYLEQYRERFYLFDDKYPFYQVPEIKGTTFYARKLNGEVSESGTNPEPQKERIFSTISGKQKGILEYGEAVRWLINLMAYDDNAVKLIGIAWLGQIGGVYATGRNLFETLLLNFTVLDSDGRPWNIGKAAWEIEINNKKVNQIAQPQDPVTLFTLQSRRILLLRDNNKIVKYTSYGGDYFSSENMKTEMMTAWKYDSAKDPAKKLVPLLHKQGKQMWQSLDNFLIESDQNHCPGIVYHVKMMIKLGFIDTNYITFHAVGVFYDKYKMSLDSIYSDKVVFDPKLITDLGFDWLERISNELKSTDTLVYNYGKLAGECYLSNGGDEGQGRSAVNKITESARTDAYALLDIPFREWLASVSVDDDIDEKSLEWQNTSKRIILKAGRDLVGRYNLQLCKTRGGTTVNIYKAFNDFERRIKYKGER